MSAKEATARIKINKLLELAEQVRHVFAALLSADLPTNQEFSTRREAVTDKYRPLVSEYVKATGP